MQEQARGVSNVIQTCSCMLFLFDIINLDEKQAQELQSFPGDTYFLILIVSLRLSISMLLIIALRTLHSYTEGNSYNQQVQEGVHPPASICLSLLFKTPSQSEPILPMHVNLR